MSIDPRNFIQSDDTEPPKNVVSMPPYVPPELLKSERTTPADDAPRTLPHAVGPEKSILSSMIQDPAKFLPESLAAGLTKDHFYIPAHSLLFGFMVELHSNGTEIEFVSLVQRLLDCGLLDRVGGPSALTDLYTYAPTPLYFPTHLRLVQDKFALRSIIQKSTEAINQAYEDPTDGAKSIAKLGEELRRLAEGSNATGSRVVRGFASFSTEIDPAIVVLGKEWLRRGDIATFIGNAGGGKSVAMGQGCLAWGLGLHYMGIAPPRPLRIIHFCGEDDEATLGQIRDGFILYSKEISGTPVDMRIVKLLDKNIRHEFSREFVGDAFHQHLDSMLRDEPADLVIINPLLSFIGGDIVAEAPKWLRAGLMPVLQRHNCAALVAHHTSKMGKNGWSETDDVYAAIGGSEMANIPRSIMTMRPTPIDDMMCVKVGKRTTTGWEDSEGRRVKEWYMRRSHDSTRPAWLPVDHAEALEAIDEESGNKGGGAKRKAGPVDVVKVIQSGPTAQSAVIEALKPLCSANPAKNAIKDAIKEGMAATFNERNPAGGLPIKWICLPEHAPKKQP